MSRILPLALQSSRFRPSRQLNELPDPPEPERLAGAIEALNARLEAQGSPRRVCAPEGRRDDRERISIDLMLALRDTADRKAFELLYRLNSRLIFCFCRTRLRRPLPGVELCDVIGDTFLAILQRAETFREGPRATFTGWALVIAENYIRQALRRTRRAGTSLAQVNEPEQPQEIDPARLAAYGESQATVRETWSTMVRLCAAAWLRLPPRWREALELREGQGLSYREIAARMGVTTGYVGMLIRRGRSRMLDQLRTALAPYQEKSHDRRPRP